MTADFRETHYSTSNSIELCTKISVRQSILTVTITVVILQSSILTEAGI